LFKKFNFLCPGRSGLGQGHFIFRYVMAVILLQITVKDLIMKTKCLFLKLAWAALALVLLFTACPNPAGSDDTPDKNTLIVKINEANTAKYSVTIAETAGQAPQGSKWATQEQMNALQAAITAAESAATPDQAAVTDATAALNAAITTFNSVVSANGPGSQSTGFTQAQFNALKEAANAAKAGVVISADGKSVPATGFWVTQADMDTFNAAIALADSVSDTAYWVLFNALAVFNAAKKNGSGDDAGTTPDKTPLIVKINEANTAKYSVTIAETAGQAPQGSKWATQEQVNALQAAITAAGSAATPDQAAVTAATAALDAAITTFNSDVNANGPGSQSTGFTQAQFNALKETAKAAKAGVVASVDGNDVPATGFWVTQAVMNTFNAAIDAEFSDSAYIALSSALTVFNAMKKSGTAVAGGNDVFEGTWVSADNFIRIEASNGSFKQYLVSGSIEFVRGTYTFLGNTATVIIIEVNSFIYDGTDVWLAWAKLPDDVKKMVGSETQRIPITGNTFTAAGYSFTKQTGDAGSSGDGAITFTGIDSQYNGQYATFRSSSSTPPTGGGDTLIGGGITLSAITGVRISNGSVTIPAYLVNSTTGTMIGPYKGNDKNIRIYLSIKDSSSFTFIEIGENTYRKYMSNSVNFTNGSASVNVGSGSNENPSGSGDGNNENPSGSGDGSGNTLVITNISAAQAGQGQDGVMIGIFPAGTSPQQVWSQTDTDIVAEADSSNGAITPPSGSAPYTVTATLYAIQDGGRWTDSGVYDIYLVLLNLKGWTVSVYRMQSVSFTNGQKTVSAASFSFVESFPIDDFLIDDSPTQGGDDDVALKPEDVDPPAADTEAPQRGRSWW
jgi:uncharacterized protein (DUF2147 family)